MIVPLIIFSGVIALFLGQFFWPPDIEENENDDVDE